LLKFATQFVLLLLPGFLVAQVFFDVDQSVKLTAAVSTTPPTITVNWQQDPRTLSYDLYRREYQDSTWGEKISNYPASTTQYVDTDVRLHRLYEYKVVKYVDGVEGYGYVLSGIERPAVHHSGQLLIVITSSTLNQIEPALNEYLAVVGTDGWQSSILTIDDNTTVSEVKAAIVTAHSFNSFSAVLLLGDVPIPHSGDIKPDGHPDHRGAWSADIYYGDLNGTWTDTDVTITQAANDINDNVPGDGKWDQSFLPSDVEVAVGRVDFSNMPVFNQDEYQLLREYLQKDIAYRTKQVSINQRAAMRNTNPWRGALGQNGIRNFSPLVSPENITYDEWEDVFNDSYLWFYGAGGGSQTAAGSLGSSFVYARSDFNAVFTGWFGSYFGDYDFEDNYMRAVLGSGTALSAVWAGAPHWHFHSMGMGFPLAHATTTTQNNDTIYTADFFPRGVHVNLLGDPTLKGYIVAPPTNLALSEQGNFIDLSWSAPSQPVDKYYVYLRTASLEPYVLIDSTTSTDLQASSQGAEVAHQYLVRAAKLTTTPSGSFTNLSSGAAATITTLTSLPGFDLEEVGVFPNPASDRVSIHTAVPMLRVELMNTSGQLIISLAPALDGRQALLSVAGVPSGNYLLRIKFSGGVAYRKLVVTE
jgi:hypothetical protein